MPPFRGIPKWRLALLALVLGTAAAQEGGKTGQAARSGSAAAFQATLVPRQVYVGDPARLILALERDVPGLEPFVVDDPFLLPRSPEIGITRVELERRQGRLRLLVDFTAWAPGSLALPVIMADPLVFPDLEVEIASILDAETAGGRAAGTGRVLSPPAPPLSMPGTVSLIYGGLVVLVFSAIILAAGRKNVPRFRRWLERRRRRRTFRGMEKFLARLAGQVRSPDGGPVSQSRPEIVESLNREFRGFLTILSGEFCAAFTAADFALLSAFGEGFDGPWLRGFFRRLDGLRFRGRDAGTEETAEILEEGRLFVQAAFRREEAGDGEADGVGLTGSGPGGGDAAGGGAA